jgi:DNA primase
VIPKKGRYYCFVCHESGDVFSWLMKRFGMDYPTAVRDAARRAGIVIPERPGRAGPDPREPLYEAVAVAQDWFTRRLMESPDAKEAREYLAGRDISLETAAVHGLGFAPKGKAFLEAMAALGVREEVLLETGLTARRDDGAVISRFRGRLLFPIHDLRGRLAGFGGRLLGPGEPKYLNSPETAIFHKGKQLYNLHAAKGAIRKEEGVILVEGYFDVLRLVLAGVEHVVAPLGTALTGDQASLLRRFANTATLLYDSDQAGLRATFRAGDEMLRHGMRVRVATLPEGEDPDSLVRAGGAAALESLLRDAVDVLERKLQLLEQRGWFEGMEHQREALDRLLPTIRAASDPITRDLYLKAVSEKTGVSREALQQELSQRSSVAGAAAAPSRPVETRPSAPTETRRRRKVDSTERSLLRVLMKEPGWLRRAVTEVPPEWFETPEFREIFENLVRSPEMGGSAVFFEQLSPGARRAWQYVDSIEPKYGSPDWDQTYTDAYRKLQIRPLKRQLEYLRLRMKEFPPDEYDALVREKQRLIAEISAHMPEEIKKPKFRRDIDAR